MSDPPATNLVFYIPGYPTSMILVSDTCWNFIYIRLYPSWQHFTSKMWPNPYFFLQHNLLGEGDDNKVANTPETHMTDTLKIAI